MSTDPQEISREGVSNAPAGAESRSNGTVARVCGYCGFPLTGSKKKRFCSDLHRMAYWDQAHPRVNRGAAGPRQGTVKALILGLLADGQWRTDQQIADAIHAFAHTVSARISELIRAGHPIESERLERNLRRRRLASPQQGLPDAPLTIEQARQAADEVADELKE